MSKREIKKQEKSKVVAQSIVDAAINLIANNNLTVKNVAAQIQIPKANVFYHMGTISNIYQSAIDQCIDKVNMGVYGGGRENIWALIQHYSKQHNHVQVYKLVDKIMADEAKSA